MGRDTTAGKRMAAKRSREKAAGLRRLNVAVVPEVLERLAELMKVHNCASQAGLVELLVMNGSISIPSRKAKEKRNAVTDAKAKTERKPSAKIQQSKSQKPVKAPKHKSGIVTVRKELSSEQMSLF